MIDGLQRVYHAKNLEIHAKTAFGKTLSFI
jgi:hypothetical protein